jgi:hypothetical protein
VHDQYYFYFCNDSIPTPPRQIHIYTMNAMHFSSLLDIAKILQLDINATSISPYWKYDGKCIPEFPYSQDILQAVMINNYILFLIVFVLVLVNKQVGVRTA